MLVGGRLAVVAVARAGPQVVGIAVGGGGGLRRRDGHVGRRLALHAHGVQPEKNITVYIS